MGFLPVLKCIKDFSLTIMIDSECGPLSIHIFCVFDRQITQPIRSTVTSGVTIETFKTHGMSCTILLTITGKTNITCQLMLVLVTGTIQMRYKLREIFDNIK